MKGTTKNGFKFDVDDEVFDDMELIDTMARYNKGDEYAVSDAIRIILGEDQTQKLYEHLRKKSKKGRVSATAVGETIGEIFEAFGEDSEK